MYMQQIFFSTLFGVSVILIRSLYFRVSIHALTSEGSKKQLVHEVMVIVAVFISIFSSIVKVNPFCKELNTEGKQQHNRMQKGYTKKVSWDLLSFQ